MIKVVYAILPIVIKDLEICLRNSNPPMRKSVICFELSVYKKETNKQTAGALFYKY